MQALGRNLLDIMGNKHDKGDNDKGDDNKDDKDKHESDDDGGKPGRFS